MAVILLLVATPALAEFEGSTGPPLPLPDHPSFDSFKANEGLPNDSVRSIIQDHLGFIWLGTHNGVVRYDGYTMVPYGPNDPDATGYLNLSGASLLEDRDGDIWIGTFATGLWRLNQTEGAFDNWGLESPPENQLGGNHVASLCQDREGSVWAALAGSGGLAIINPETRAVRRWRLQAGQPRESAPPDTTLTTVMQDDAGRLWVTSEGKGLAWHIPGTSTWHHLRYDRDDPFSLPSNTVTHILQDDLGRIWVTTRLGLARYDEATGRFTHFAPDPNDRSSMANYLVQMDQDRWGRLWIGSAVNLYLFDPATGVFRQFSHDPDREDSILRGPILSVLCDSAGIVWCGAWHAGLNKLDPGAHRFGTTSQDTEQPGSLDFEMVLSLLEDSQGTLWVGTGERSTGLSMGGLNSRVRGEASFVHHPFPPDDPVQPTAVLSLHESRDGILWIGSNQGLWRMFPGHTSPQRIPGVSVPNGAPLALGSIQAITSDPQGNIWIGSYHRGLFVLERDTGKLRHYTPDPADSTSLPQINVNRLFRDQRGRIWVGMDTHGLAIHDPSTDTFTSCFDPPRGLESPLCFQEMDDGSIWLGSFAGLLQLDQSGNVQQTITIRDGLPNSVVSAILADDLGRLWISTGNGFARYDTNTREFRTYDLRDGLLSTEVHMAAVKSRQGTFHFGGKRGLVEFDPFQVRDSAFVPPVLITEIRVADQPLQPGADSPLTGPVELSTELVLKHDQNDLTFGFASLHFARPSRNSHRYLLEGEDDDWRDPGEEHHAFYTNLSPGHYTFRVRGSNADGLWNPAETILQVQILPPWWRTAWATSFYILLAIGVALLIYRQIINRERMRTALEIERAEAHQWQQLDHLRTRFFANVSHEFRTPLTLLLGPLRRLEANPTSGDADLFAMMGRNARRLTQLIDQLLDLSRLEAGRLPVQWRRDDAVSFLRGLVSTFETLAGDRGINMETNFPTDSLDSWFDADLLEKVTTNLLSNALKYTPNGGTVRASLVSGEEIIPRTVPQVPGMADSSAEAPARIIRLAVANTGSYIPPEEQPHVFDRFRQMSDSSRSGSTGIGLALVKELVTLQGGTIDLSSDEERGTCFTVDLPVFLEAPPGAMPEPSAEETAAEAELYPLESEDSEDSEVSVAAEPEKPRILVVEDNDDLRGFLVRELSPDFTVLEAPDGDKGLAKALADVPDLIVSDVMMPGIDGFELCRRLKQDLRTSHVPIVLLTARAEIESRLTGLQQGADDYLAKPFDARELRVRILNLVEMRRALQQQYATQVQHLELEAMPVASADDRFLHRCREMVDEHLDDTELTVESFAREVGLSRAQLHRKLKALTGMGARDFIRSHRLQRAADLLAGRYGNVTEVAYSTGFKSLSHFARCFREQFGVAPSDYPASGKESH